jgi:hypothetical protein
VLVVDDEPDARELLRRVLSALSQVERPKAVKEVATDEPSAAGGNAEIWTRKCTARAKAAVRHNFSPGISG